MTAIADEPSRDDNSKILMESLALLEHTIDQLDQAVTRLSQKLSYVCLPRKLQNGETNVVGIKVEATTAPLVEVINGRTNQLIVIVEMLLDIECRCVLPFPDYTY